MKHLITLSAIVVFAMVTPQVTAQSGGFNVKNVKASENVTVGSESDKQIQITNRAISLPPLTKEEINALTPQEGMLVYDTESDVVMFYSAKESMWLSVISPEPEPVVPCESIYRDQNGHIFFGVQIGDQCWMDRNLKATHYPNGEAIPYVTNDSDWKALEGNNTADAYCYYGNNTNSEYGALYTYAAAIAHNWTKDNDDVTNGEGGQGICPDGWHLPTVAEWTILIEDYLGSSVAGGKMKEAGTSHWNSPNTGANNQSGFTALPGGRRQSYDGNFANAGNNGYWWSATTGMHTSNGSQGRGLSYNDASLDYITSNRAYGYSIRCLRD